MRNTLVQGSEIFSDEVEKPINQNKSMVLEVVSYSKPIAVCVSPWDKAVTKQQFFVWVVKKDNVSPENSEIDAGSFLRVRRVGVDNKNTATPTTFALYSDTLLEPSFFCSLSRISGGGGIVYTLDTEYYIDAVNNVFGDVFVEDLGGGSYECYRRVSSHGTSLIYEAPHQRAGVSWNLNLYDNVDASWNYSGLSASYTTTVNSDDQNDGETNFDPGRRYDENSKYIYIPVAGTGISGKVSRYPPGANIYFNGALKSPQFEEQGTALTGNATSGTATYLQDDNTNFRGLGVKIGMTINITNPNRSEIITNIVLPLLSEKYSRVVFASGAPITPASTYSIPVINRKGVIMSSGSLDHTAKIFTHFAWIMSIRAWRYYNIGGDTVSQTVVEDYSVLDGHAGAVFGINEESTMVVVGKNTSPSTTAAIPGWPEITDATAYCVIAPVFVASRNIDGGRVYFPRFAADWFIWNGASFVAATAGQSAQRLWLADRYNGDFREYGENLILGVYTGIVFS